MDEFVLDKIIGSSPINRNIFAVHHASGHAAFASAGFFSLIAPNDRRRSDFKVSETGHEIEALSFSRTGRCLAVGAKGPEAYLYVLNFNKEFDNIESKHILKTKENGFSSISVDYNSGKLISCGNDEQPYLLLWNLKLPRPSVVGYYHLATTPTQVFISSDGSHAIVSGNHMLMIFNLNIPQSDTPVLLEHKRINTGKLKDENFVSCYSGPATQECPSSTYALTDNGVLYAFRPSVTSFDSSHQKRKSVTTINTIELNCGPTSSMAVDDKLVTIGNDSGTIIAISRKGSHTIAGQFSADGRALVATGVSDRLVSGAYDNGTIIFYRRKNRAKPLLVIPGHRGPVCALAASADGGDLYSAGSDGTLRLWRVQKNQGLVGKSSQEMVAAKKLSRLSTDYLTSLKGVRCISVRGEQVFAGDSHGVLHVLSGEKLHEAQRIQEDSRGTLSVDSHPLMPMVVTGGSDGVVRLYTLAQSMLSLTATSDPSSGPISSVAFAGNSVVSASVDGVCFMRMPNLGVYAEHAAGGAVLSLAVLPNKKFVVSSGVDQNIRIWRVEDGSLFRTFKLSQSAYPTAIAVDKIGLFIAAAMSDSFIFIIDVFSGDVVRSFGSMGGVITSALFRDGDLTVSSSLGCIMKWSVSREIEEAIKERECAGNMVLDILGSQLSTDSRPVVFGIPGSFIPGGQELPEWMFREERVEIKAPDENIEVETEDEADAGTDAEDESESKDMAKDKDKDEELRKRRSSPEQSGYDDPRPSVFGQNEQRVDDFIRASYIDRGSFYGFNCDGDGDGDMSSEREREHKEDKEDKENIKEKKMKSERGAESDTQDRNASVIGEADSGKASQFTQEQIKKPEKMNRSEQTAEAVSESNISQLRLNPNMNKKYDKIKTGSMDDDDIDSLLQESLANADSRLTNNSRLGGIDSGSGKPTGKSVIKGIEEIEKIEGVEEVEGILEMPPEFEDEVTRLENENLLDDIDNYDDANDKDNKDQNKEEKSDDGKRNGNEMKNKRKKDDLYSKEEELKEKRRELARLFGEAELVLSSTSSSDREEESAFQRLNEVVTDIQNDAVQSKWLSNIIVDKISELFI